MFRRSVRWVAVYLIGIVVVWGWALSHLLGGTLTRENFALVVVLPLAWTISFPGMASSLIVVQRIRGLGRVLEEMRTRVQTGVATAEQERELEDVLTTLAARENGLPERLIRPFVRRVLHVLVERARRT